MLRFLLIALALLGVCDLTATMKASSQKEEPKANKDREAPTAQEPAQSLSVTERQQRLREISRLLAETGERLAPKYSFFEGLAFRHD
jgi:hypothetical protein